MVTFPLDRELRVLSWGAALAYVVAGLLCLVGVLISPTVWEKATVPLGLAFVISAVILTFRASDLLAIL